MTKSKSAKVLHTHTPSLFEAAVARASEHLRAGRIVALPTETVYGLAANALDAKAVARIYEVKGRPPHNPIIVHVAGVEMARRCVKAWTGLADKLAKAFWPGPLTMVLARADDLPEVVTAGGTTVGVRWPNHPLIQAVIQACGFPLAAPSANRSGEVSPTSAEHVRRSLGDKIPLIVDGGPAPVGIESTVLDLTASPPRVLRPGMIHAESLLRIMGTGTLANAECETPPAASEHRGDSCAEPLHSPGLLPRHYAPKAKLRILRWRDDADLRRQLSAAGCPLPAIHVISHAVVPSPFGFGRLSVIPHDAEAFARALYAELHRCDEEGAGLIVVEAPPDSASWRAIADRLRRAAA